jgi:hypothetical protein
MNASTADNVSAILAPLVGLPLRAARRAADLRGFHFGDLRPNGKGESGAYVIHVQCAWRIEHGRRLYTGSGDLWTPSADCTDTDDWTYEQGNLQDERLAALLGSAGAARNAVAAETRQLIVESASGSESAGAVIELSGDYRLVIFPDASCGESWRLLGHAVQRHIVVVAGEVHPYSA